MPSYLLYDGECGLCRAAADWIRERDRRGDIRLIPYQDPERVQLFPQLDPEKMEKEIHLIFADGRMVVGAAAFAEILSLLPRTRWLGMILRLPVLRSIAERVYHYIARNRYRLMTGTM